MGIRVTQTEINLLRALYDACRETLHCGGQLPVHVRHATAALTEYIDENER